MRHDPAAAAIVIMLRSLKMYGMAQAVEDLIEQGAPAFEAAIPILSQLLKAELAEREVRSIACMPRAVATCVLPVPGPPIRTTFCAPSRNSQRCNVRTVASLISETSRSTVAPETGLAACGSKL